MAITNYNGIVIPYCEVRRFEHKAIYDESNTDLVYMEIDLEVSGYIHLEYLGHIFDVNKKWGKDFRSSISTLYQQLGASGIISYMRSRLLQPRREFHFWVNGIDMIPRTHTKRSDTTKDQPRYIATPPFFVDVGVALPATPYVPNPEFDPAAVNDFADSFAHEGFTDANNGPKPKFCNIIKMTDTMFHVSFGITGRYYESRSKSNLFNILGNGVISNRWSESISLDAYQYTTRTRKGKFIVRSDGFEPYVNRDIATSGRAAIPQNFIKMLGNLAVPSGFSRVASSYVLSPDGLAIDYTVTDKEIFKNPPIGALTASGTYTEKLGPCGVVRHGALSLTLKGGKSHKQSVILFKAIAIAMQKLAIRGLDIRGVRVGGVDPASYLQYLHYEIGMWENSVTVSASALLPPISGFLAFSLPNIETEGLVFTPLCDAYVPRTPTIAVPVPVVLPLPRATAPPRQQNPTWPSDGYTILGSANLIMRAAAYWDPSLNRQTVPHNKSEVFHGDVDNPTGAQYRSPIPGETSLYYPQDFGYVITF